VKLASEQILSLLRFQEPRGGNGVCQFGFKVHPPALLFAVVVSWLAIEFLSFIIFYCSRRLPARGDPWSG